ncbi:hypothetical protein I7I50_12623 [Histoplasma capsulatum G186AR]|uniref:Uncharacterized protein n=1 Tax=Ajellomyces capsulatus TaxID=5037 RepID=A0A8H7YAC5_AJECA|nr:hypothetical protein I7I52_11072 [Histoplasma capsulatum]QSS70853.1 hypothetical protein I7I50_12623 [Histoplasma capsulatum G186AR]
MLHTCDWLSETETCPAFADKGCFCMPALFDNDHAHTQRLRTPRPTTPYIRDRRSMYHACMVHVGMRNALGISLRRAVGPPS